MYRIFWVDVARCIAILLVVFTHAHEQAGVNGEVIKGLLYSIDRMGVPLFFMLSGGLLLPKIHKIGVLDFYKKRIPQFVILLVFYSVITNFVHLTISGNGMLTSMLQSLRYHNGIYPANYGYAAQMWFMYSIIQLYLIAPYLSRLVIRLSNAELFVFLLLCLAFNQVRHSFPVMGIEWNMLGRMGGEFTGAYVAYFIAGYMIMDRNIDVMKPLSSKLVNSAMIIIPMLIVAVIEFGANKLIDSLHWYSASLFLFVSSVGLLLLIKRTFDGRYNNIVASVGVNSFGIYLVHYIFLAIMVRSFKPILHEANWWAKALLYFSVAFLCSYMYSHYMMKSRKMKYLVS